MKTLVFPREKRTEFVGDADDGPWVVAEQVKAAVAQAKGQVLISFGERRDEQGQTCYAVISRALPRMGQAIKLTIGETAVGIFPAGDGAEQLVINTEHSTGCPRAKKDRADCICAGILTIHKRDAGHWDARRPLVCQSHCGEGLMFFPNPALQAPTRITFEEAWSVRRRGSIADMRREVRRRRLEHVPDVMNGRRAAWALVVTGHALRKFIEDGHLRADLVENRYGKQHFEITAGDLVALAEELA